MIKDFLLSFVPLFVAIDALGTVPIFLSMTHRLPVKKQKRLVYQATLTALVISMTFLIGGKMIFQFLGITEDDFRIGGGIVLLILAVRDLALPQVHLQRKTDEGIGIVPIGIPLMMGPAALTTILILEDSFGILTTFIALIVNLLIVWIAFYYSSLIQKILGKGGSAAIAKVSSLFLVAIAVMMIRIGITNEFIRPFLTQ